MKFYHYETGQHPLYTTQRGLLIALKLFINAIVYAPLLVTGYAICTLVLSRGSEGLLWVGLTVLFAIILYCLLQLLKKGMIALKAKGSYWWIPLFIFCVAFTYILPLYIVYHPLNYLVIKLRGNKTVTDILAACFTLYVYYKYDFFNRQKS